MAARADAALCSAIRAVDILRANTFLEAAFRALANMALSEASQCDLGAGDAMIWCVRTLSQSSHVLVLRAASHATAAIAYKSLANKAHFAQLGAISACLRVVSQFGSGSLDHTAQYVPAVYATSLAACTLLSFNPNHLVFEDCQGIEIYTTLCQATEHMKLLKVGSMVLATIAPTAHERWEAFAEGRALHFENAGGLRALTRGVKWAFAHTKPPKWLQTVIASLQMNSIHLEEAYGKSGKSLKQVDSPCLRGTELFPRHELFEELLVYNQLDHIMSTSQDLHSLAFRLY